MPDTTLRIDRSNTTPPADPFTTAARWSAYGLAALAATGVAHAAVVEVDLTGLTTTLGFTPGNNGPAPFEFDLDGDGVRDLAFQMRDFGSGAGPSGTIFYLAKTLYPAGAGTSVFTDPAFTNTHSGTTTNYVKVFGPGAVIGPNTADAPDIDLLANLAPFQIDDFSGYYALPEGSYPYAAGVGPRPYPSLNGGALGFSFTAGVGTTHYAYALISYEDAQASPITVEAIYFESTPDTAITVVPEPSALAMLAAGVLGVAGYRRRCRAAA